MFTIIFVKIRWIHINFKFKFKIILKSRHKSYVLERKSVQLIIIINYLKSILKVSLVVMNNNTMVSIGHWSCTRKESSG